jgi:rhodanese-related sulfurtransferase
VEVPEIDVDELARQHAAGAPIVDVRQTDEFEESRVPGSTLIPLATIPDHLTDLTFEHPVYLICRTGARSGRAAQWLRQQGVDAVNVAGGMVAWIEAGHPVDTGPQG